MGFFLPFNVNPLVCQYLLNAHTLGIIQANAELLGKDITPWLCCKYINCSYRRKRSFNNATPFSVQIFDGDATNDNVLSNFEIQIPEKDIKSSKGSVFLDFLKKLISSGYYITGMINEKFIPCMSAYKKYDYPHSFLLFGFDDDACRFSSAGFVSNQRFSGYYINYLDFYNGISDIVSRKKYAVIKVIRYNKGKKYVVNYHRAIQVFSDYCKSENTLSINNSTDELFGIEAVQSLSYDFLEIIDCGKELDIRFTRGLSDSKMMTYRAVNFLSEYFSIVSMDIIDSSEKVSKMANQIHMMALKYNISREKEIRNTIEKCFSCILSLEKEYMPRFIEKLKQIKDFPPGTFIGAI